MTRPADVPALGLYVHWPYCARICPYCDFNVVRERGRAEEKAALTTAILKDMAAHATLTGTRSLASIFFGGGTPSLMAPADVARIIEGACALWPAARDIEITLEANPTDAEAGAFAALAAAGVNRLSLGVQSLNDISLHQLGRNHDSAAARRAIDIAASLFPRLSIDLIYALPGQSLQGWSEELAAAATLGAEHVSAYQLTIEPGAAFARAVRRGALRPVESDEAAAFYDVTQAVLGAAGFEAYEVSNHALGPAARSRHNLIYWRGDDYLGLGPGAHGRLTVKGARHATAAPRKIADYIASAGAGGLAAEPERLDRRDVALERLLMGMRTNEGVAMHELEPLAIAPTRLDALSEFVVIERGRLRSTAAGRVVLDAVVAELAHDA